MKKPLTVLALEFLAWVFFAAASCGAAFFLLRAAFYAHYRSGFQMSGTLFLVLLSILFAAMLHAVRRARFAWFSVPPCVVMILTGGLISSHMDSVLAGIGLFLLVCVTALVPVVLLNLPKAKAWQKEMFATRGKDKAGLMVALSLFALFYAAVSIPSCVHSDRALVLVAETQAEAINCGFAENNSAREKGGEWVDPAGFTNSTQFIRAVMTEVSKCPDPQFPWCVAVNPPDDSSFPVLFTYNVDVGELLKIGDEKRKLGLTCPAERGGRCLQFCPAAAVVLRRDGSVSVIYANNLTPEELFGGKVLRLAPDTYFLTPTGRVDVVERQAAVSL